MARLNVNGLDIPADALPNHVAIIPDGNRRWARARGLPPLDGHKEGAKRLQELIRFCPRIGISTLTFWAFSSENWSRDEKETRGLLKGIENGLKQHLKEAIRDKVRIVHLGRKDRLPVSLVEKLRTAEEETNENNRLILNLAIDYGGQDELLRAAREMVEDGVTADRIDDKLFASYLDTANQPYPNVDLLIRTSGEQRISGYLPWQMNYSEIWWEEANFPDFTVDKFTEVLLDYFRRRRRFGGNDSEKVRKIDFQPRLVAKFDIDWRRAMELKERGEFREAFVNYMREQFGISVSIARDATEIFLKALIKGETEGDWKGTKRILTRFYTLLQNNVKLAFEPSLVASLEIDYLKGSNGDKRRKVELDKILTKLYAELFRIPLLQAEKVAHLRVLAQQQEEEAKLLTGKNKKRLTKSAEEYLVRSYEALKERIA